MSVPTRTSENQLERSAAPKGAVPGKGAAQPRSERPIRVLIADDHTLVRQGLRAILAEDVGLFEICGEAANGCEALSMARKTRPDVVVLDLSMPQLNGLEATRLIRKELPGTEVLILTMHQSEPLVTEILQAGARGYLSKTDVARDLPAAIESLGKHRPFLTSSIAQNVLEGYLKRGSDTDVSVLTPAERRIVQLLAEGRSNKEVANLQNISVKTAEIHRAHISHKLGFKSMSDLVHYAVRNGIIEA